jgi:hypothetical protein
MEFVDKVWEVEGSRNVKEWDSKVCVWDEGSKEEGAQEVEIVHQHQTGEQKSAQMEGKVAPGLFTLLIKETLRPLREIGIAVTSWIDDGMVLAKTKEELLYIRDHILRPRLESLGWKINWEKCQWVMLRAIRELEKSGEIKLRRVAKVMGVLVSVKDAWSPALVFSRAGFRTLQQAQRTSWGTKMMPDPQLLEDLILTTKLLATGGKRLIQQRGVVRCFTNRLGLCNTRVRGKRSLGRTRGGAVYKQKRVTGISEGVISSGER